MNVRPRFSCSRSSTAKIPGFGINLLKQTIPILIQAFLSRTIGIGKIVIAI